MNGISGYFSPSHPQFDMQMANDLQKNSKEDSVAFQEIGERLKRFHWEARLHC